MKRILDIVLSLLGIVLASPIMLIIAILLRIDSPGKTIFSQDRLGKGGKVFKIHKFRKFPQDWGTKGAGVTTQNDVRMTSFGAFLERTKLDELPQLWNILNGEMSFVGPRPESLRYQHLFEGKYKQLLDFTPGVFGPNQVEFRNESAMYPMDKDPEEFYQTFLFPTKAENDINYFSQATLLKDFHWMFKCLLTILYGAVNWGKETKRYGLILFLDFLLFQLAWFLSYVFRFEGLNFSEPSKEVYITGVWLIPLIIFPLMFIGGVYRHPFRYFSVSDAIRLFTVTLGSWAVAFFIQFGFFQRNLSVGIAILCLFLLIGFMGMPRIYFL